MRLFEETHQLVYISRLLITNRWQSWLRKGELMIGWNEHRTQNRLLDGSPDVRIVGVLIKTCRHGAIHPVTKSSG